MWMIILFFAGATLMLAWLLFGYVVWLRFVGDGRARAEVSAPTSFPMISVLVPCLNEAPQIAEKYRNIQLSTYPRERLEIVFADGGSTDGTLGVLESLARNDSQTTVVSCPSSGKIAQLNHALTNLRGDLVVVTDADARWNDDALEWIAAEFEADPNVAVVGACTAPRGGLKVERCFWKAQNRIRSLESDVSHVSMVIACCYAFRQELITQFPSDVIADDVYVAAFANTLGHHTLYSTRAFVEELRTPATLPAFFTHKFRKSNAVFRELLRFAYRLPDMDGRWRSILTTRIVQQILLPWGTLSWLLSAVALVNLRQFDVLALGAGLLVMGLFATRRATMAVELPGQEERFSLLTLGLAYIYTMAVLCVTGLTYWSYRQDSRYARLATTPRSMDRAQVETQRTRPETLTPQTSTLSDTDVVPQGAAGTGASS